MNVKSFYIMLVMVIMAGCSTGKDLAQSTRTGKIYDVRLGESVEPRELTVRVGDEVRWINARNAPVRIVFVDTLQDQVVCEKDFKLKPKTTWATISANDYASLCFMMPGSYIYNARMQTPVPGGETNMVGRILVE
jgi:plastocyanin